MQEGSGVHWDVKDVRVEPDWTLLVRFSDGLTGRVRFLPGFFTVDQGAVAWPGDLDLAPDAMYAQIKTG